ncbi:MAG: hypothetical protein P1V20_10890 [Verrucomicrobiales bacterium]|nr:hypothetical protein [Verrucomicrobiales bacterium]
MRFLCVVAAVFLLLPNEAFAWGGAHVQMTGAAFAVQSEAFRKTFSENYDDPFDQTLRPLSWHLVNRFTMHPDAVDGPCRNEADIPKRIRATQFVFAQRGDKFMAPIAYADPQKSEKGPRPKTYHYFTLQTEELNRIFARKGAEWYFRKIGLALQESRTADAAEFLGAFAHAIEDRVSPYHVWDGFAVQREELESQYPGLQAPEGSWKGNPGSASLIWALGGKNVKVNLSGYEPQALGEDIESAAEAFTQRLFESREHARKIYSRENGYISVHLQDDWQNRAEGVETGRILSEVAQENSRLVADVMLTAWILSGIEK